MTQNSSRIWRGAVLTGAALAVGGFALASSTGVTSTKAAATVASVTKAAATAPLPHGAPPGHKLGFVVTYFYHAMYQGPDACPHGMQPIASTEEFIAKLPPAERVRLQKSENAHELFQKMSERGPHGENVCKDPSAAPPPVMYTLQGNRNDGLNLDGSKDPKHSDSYVCPHTKYVGDDGTIGVDNQLGRALACISGMREKGTLAPYFTTQMRSGMWSMLIEVTGVDDVRNDPDVTVDIYAGDENMVRDPSGNVLAGASLSPKTDPKLHRQFKGWIKDGVLETSPIKDFYLPDIMLTSRLPPWLIERPRLKLTLLANGGAKGYFGGYMPISHYQQTSGDTGAQGEHFTGQPCNFMWWAVKQYADGGKNPKTGQCETISTSFRIEAVPAFIVHQDKQAVRTFANVR